MARSVKAQCIEPNCVKNANLAGTCHAHRLPPPRPQGWVDLVCAVIRDTPRLDGAACRHRPQLFDLDVADNRAVVIAATVCERCPVIAECNAFAESEGGTGVFAGRVWLDGRSFSIADWLFA